MAWDGSVGVGADVRADGGAGDGVSDGVEGSSSGAPSSSPGGRFVSATHSAPRQACYRNIFDFFHDERLLSLFRLFDYILRNASNLVLSQRENLSHPLLPLSISLSLSLSLGGGGGDGGGGRGVGR